MISSGLTIVRCKTTSWSVQC